MEPSSSTVRLPELYQSLAGRYLVVFSVPSTQRTALIVLMVAAGVLMVFLLAAILFLPSKRKVVRRRRVRRVRRRADAQAGVAAAQVAAAQSAAAPEVVQPIPAGRTIPTRRATGAVVWTAVWVVLLVSTVAAVYTVTGTNRYCGETCHSNNSDVVKAVKVGHSDCIDCHESGPISGLAARVRMAIASRDTSGEDVISAPVDPNSCLRCHAAVVRETFTTEAGLMVSHKEILAGGRTCSDCHPETGHVVRTSIAGGMSRCTPCHDGVTAASACETCHVGGSPITVANPTKKIHSDFNYGPAVRAANRNCARCHGSEKKCRDCHNGFVLPHPKAFVQREHARLAAFGGKERCFKCHTIAWCGDQRCHNGFSAHSEATWPARHQTGTSEQCGSCHIAWSGRGSFCDMCH